MRPRILRHPEVKNDLKEIGTYIGWPHASRFLAAAEAAFRRLCEMPFLAGVYESDEPRFANIRVWPIPGFENYLIFYRPIEHGISVLQVMHGARNIDRILRS